MRADIASGTVYDKLRVWAQSQGLSADTALEMAVDAFYKKNLEDERLETFFEGANLSALKNSQVAFMQYVFSDGRIGHYTEQSRQSTSTIFRKTL